MSLMVLYSEDFSPQRCPVTTSFMRSLPLEWDATSSVRRSSRLSEELEGGFTKVQGSKARRQNQVQAVQLPKKPNPGNANGQNNAHMFGPVLANGYANVRDGPSRARGGRGNGTRDHTREKPTNHAPPPDRSSTQRRRPQSSAELASQRGEPAAGETHLQLILANL